MKKNDICGKKLEVLLVGSTSHLAGIEAFERDLVNESKRGNVSISIMLEEGVEAPNSHELEKKGVRFFHFCPRKKDYRRYLEDVRRIYSENHFDVIHVNVVSCSPFELVACACKYSDSAVIMHSHSSGYSKMRRTKILHRIGKRVLRRYDFWKIACSKEAGEYMFGGDDFTVMHNGIDYDRFAFSNKNRTKIRNELSIKQQTFVIGDVSSFMPSKNLPFLIEVFRILKSAKNDSKLLLIGDGREMINIRSMVHDYSLDEDVVFLGRRNDVHEIYSALDVYVMPSISEGLSVAICEAQANGLPCVASTGVTKESDISGNVVFLDLSSPEEWAKVIKNSKRKNDLALLDEFNVANSTDAMFRYYRRITKEKDDRGKQLVKKDREGLGK